jgi:acetoin utilization protein AcuC
MPPADAIRRAIFMTHPTFSEAAFGRHHPLSINRHGTVVELCRSLGWLEEQQFSICPLADLDTLARFHGRGYLAALADVSQRVSASPEVRTLYNLGTMECPVFPGLWERARASVGGAVAAARLALDGALPFHPAGGTHHGRPDRASGFCYLHDPVFAILTLLDAGLERVLYVDFDAHHGDGVQDAFAGNHCVMTISIHEAGRWPGTGSLDDRGRGRAWNMPVPRGFNDSEFDVLMSEALLPLADSFRPSACVITCGVDALAGDPLSGLALSNGALVGAVEALIALDVPTVVLGGGGYNPWTLARAWTALWGRLDRRTAPDRLPPAARSILEGLDCDLVDEDDRNPAWLETLVDKRNNGPVRDEIDRIVASVRSRKRGVGA